MSYRYRFARAPKGFVNKVRDMTSEEFIEFSIKNNNSACEEDIDDSIRVNVWEMFKQKEIFDMGDCPYAEEIMNVSEKLFRRPETDKYYEESDIYLCTEKAFLAAIEGMRKLNENYYKKLIENPELVPLFLKEKSEEWGNMSEVFDMSDCSPERKQKIDEQYRPYNLDVEDAEIVKSWRYEYVIFELVRIYKCFDWENNYLIFYGW